MTIRRPTDRFGPARARARAFCAVLVATALVSPAATATATGSGSQRARAGGHVPTGRVVMRFETGAPPAVRSRALGRAGVPADRVRHRGHDLAVVTPGPGETPAEAARRLAGQPGVSYAAPEGRVRALDVAVPPGDPAYTGADGQAAYLGPGGTYTYSVNLEPAWDRAFNETSHTLVPGRAGVTMAIIDSGVSMPYAESTGEFVPVWDFIGWDADTSDVNGHGTRVASILRAKADNATGIAGVLHSSGNRVLVYRVLDGSGYGETADFLDAIYDAADRGARVINCSLGESLYDGYGVEVPGLRDSYEHAVAYARARGAVIVAAAGNEDVRVTPWTFTYAPACVDAAVAVGSVSPLDGTLSSFSNYGEYYEIDLVAGGEGIWSVNKAGTSVTGNGTSYATPVVAGSLALLMSVAPSADPTTAVDALMRSCQGYPVKDAQTGYGLPDVDEAYADLVTRLPEQPAVTLTAATPDGRAVTLSWSAAEGQGVSYLYGEAGGPAYATGGTSARVVLSDEGTRTLWLRSYATDRWSHQETLTAETLVPTDGLGPLTAARLEGATRYDTAAAISRDSFPASAPAVVLASGANWPDALAAAPLAAVTGGPLLLTDPSALSIQARDEILRLAPSRIFVIGGTAAVAAAVTSRLETLQAGDDVTRIAGADRYATAASVAEQIAAEQGGVPARRAFVCSGANFADALSGAAAAGAAGQPMLLTPQDRLASPTADAIAALGITDTVVLGGTGAVSDDVYVLLPSPERVAGIDRYATSRGIADRMVGEGTLSFGDIGISRGDLFPDALAAGAYMAAGGGPLLLAPTALDAAGAAWLASRGPQVAHLTAFGGPAAVSYGLENSVRMALRGQ